MALPVEIRKCETQMKLYSDAANACVRIGLWWHKVEQMPASWLDYGSIVVGI